MERFAVNNAVFGLFTMEKGIYKTALPKEPRRNSIAVICLSKTVYWMFNAFWKTGDVKPYCLGRPTGIITVLHSSNASDKVL